MVQIPTASGEPYRPLKDDLLTFTGKNRLGEEGSETLKVFKVDYVRQTVILTQSEPVHGESPLSERWTFKRLQQLASVGKMRVARTFDVAAEREKIAESFRKEFRIGEK